jgi:MoaA/NifB/PqqE/SkfB family radical SAM enzyme
LKILAFETNAQVEKYLASTSTLFFSKEKVFLKFSEVMDINSKLKIIKKIINVNKNVTLFTTIYDFIHVYFPLNIVEMTYMLELHEEVSKVRYLDINTRDLSHQEKAFKAHELNGLIDQYNSHHFAVNIIIDKRNLQKINSIISVAVTNKKIKEICLSPDANMLQEYKAIIKNKFDILKTYETINIPLYFSPFLYNFENWEASTKNPYRGPRYIDIDLSNFCNHNCVFCGLYNDDAQEKIKNKKIDQKELDNLYRGQLSKESFYNIVTDLPFNISYINLGGAGEPTAHPHFFEFLSELRHRNININIFSHFTFMTVERIEKLHAQGNEHFSGLHFIVNISAGSGRTYRQIRSNQKEEQFEKVIKLLKLASDMRKKDGRGIFFTYMSVTNILNYKEIPLMVAKAKEVDAHELWIKPIEVHGEETLDYIITAKQLDDYLIHLKLGLYFADHLDVKIMHRNVIESILKKYTSDLNKVLNTKNFSQHIKESLINFPELAQQFTSSLELKSQSATERQSLNPLLYDGDLSADFVQNAGLAKKLYDKIPCNIGHEYIRFGVNGEVWPCCISKYPLSHNGSSGITKTWQSQSLTHFRKITSEFPKTKQHRNDDDWSFCQQCCHIEINSEHENYSHVPE